MDSISDDLLIEIFVRVPNCRSAIQCSAVCKRWFSLISDPRFVSCIAHRASPLPYTFLLQFRRRSVWLNHRVCSAESGNLLDPTAGFLSFLPVSQPIVLASCNDLLLVASSGPEYTGTWIASFLCNPVTRQWGSIPRCPDLHTPSCGLACDRDRRRFKVVRFLESSLHNSPPYEFRVGIFSSDTGKWERATVQSPLNRPLCFTPSRAGNITAFEDGTLCWLVEKVIVSGLVTFNPFNGAGPDGRLQCNFFKLPTDLWMLNVNPRAVSEFSLRVVGGRLHLACLEIPPAPGRSPRLLKILELGGDSDSPSSPPWPSWSWRVKHRMWVKLPQMPFCVLSLHPNDSNVVFLLQGESVLRYQCPETAQSNGICEVVSESPEGIMQASYLSAFLLRFPTWPTPLPPLTLL